MSKFSSILKFRSPKRQSSTVYEKVCAKLSRSLTSSVSSPSLKKAPLASEDDLEDDLKNSPRVQLRKTSNGGQRRCHSEVCIQYIYSTCIVIMPEISEGSNYPLPLLADQKDPMPLPYPTP